MHSSTLMGQLNENVQKMLERTSGLSAVASAWSAYDSMRAVKSEEAGVE